MPIASASWDWCSHCCERTSSSTCQVAADPPASAIARSKAWVTVRAVRESCRPIGWAAGGAGMARESLSLLLDI